MMLDPLFKAVARSIEARKMMASIISCVTDIKKEDIIDAKFLKAKSIEELREIAKGEEEFMDAVKKSRRIDTR